MTVTAEGSHPTHNSATKDGLTGKVYRGDGAAMLAFDLDEKLAQNLAGFSVRRTNPKGQSDYLHNRLHFTSCVTADTQAEELGLHPTNEAPLQKFRWIDIPEEMMPGDFRYEVTAMFFGEGGKLQEGPAVSVALEIEPRKIGRFEFGFTRAYLDDAPLHTKPGALEIDAHKLLVKSAGDENVKQGHFHRFAHKKILIQKRDGVPVKVLTGSANFSVRGLYVQANNILVIDDPQTAALYEAAFEQSFHAADKFSTSELARGWHEVEAEGLPKFAVYDPAVTAAYAVEAIRLVDHYHFRAQMKSADASSPLCLQGPDAADKWWRPYYDPETIYYHERALFSR